MSQVTREALADIRAGIRLRRVWIALAHEDIGDKHRRTTLGPLWLLINYLIYAATFIFVFQRGASSMVGYPIYVATGLVVWFYIMEIINQSVTLFAREENFIKGTSLPLSVYVMRLMMQSVIRAGYAFIGCVVILGISGAVVTFAWLWAALGIILIFATTPPVIVIFAFVGAFFPDSQYIISNTMRIGMFLTPVFWVYDSSHGVRHILYHWNPFTYFLEIVRTPILLGYAPAASFSVCLVMSCLAWIMAVFLLGRLRRRVVFVL